MKKKLSILLCLTLLILSGCRASGNTIRFGAADIGGMYYSFANTFTELANEEYDNYKFEVRDNVEFEDLELLDETRAILANIFKDYWATPYQRERILAKEQYDRQKVDEEKQKKYNSNDLFKRKNINDTKEIESSNNENLPVIVKEEKFYRKLINFIRKLLRM